MRNVCLMSFTFSPLAHSLAGCCFFFGLSFSHVSESIKAKSRTPDMAGILLWDARMENIFCVALCDVFRVQKVKIIVMSSSRFSASFQKFIFFLLLLEMMNDKHISRCCRSTSTAPLALKFRISISLFMFE
jgi:hypothetical protein